MTCHERPQGGPLQAVIPIRHGESVKVVQERLGHASIRITLDLYSHVLPDTQRASADRLDEALGA